MTFSKYKQKGTFDVSTEPKAKIERTKNEW
jgi:hypothetical protein